MNTHPHLIHGVVCAAVIAFSSNVGAATPAEAFPQKPVRFIVPFVPGAGTDITTRALSAKLSQMWGQQVVADNRSGAGGAIAAEITARADPDGYTICLISAGHSVLSASGNPIPYDLEKDLQAIAQVTSLFYVLTVHPSLPAKSVAELIAYARANPGKLNYGTGNTTSILATAQLKSLAGIDMVQVPYKGDAPATTDLLGGRVDLVIASTVPGLALAKEGKIGTVATLLTRRSAHLPDAPTMSEAGFPEYSVTSWAAIFGPAKLPRPIVERLTREINAILQRPEVKEQLERQAFEYEGSTPEALGSFVKNQLEVWRRAVREAGIPQE